MSVLWESLHRTKRIASLAWAWGLLALLGLWFAPQAKAQVQNAWEPVWSQGDLSIKALTTNPAIPGTVYAIYGDQYHGGLGVLKSSDGGTSWDQVYYNSEGVTSLVVDPGVPGTVYVGVRASNAFLVGGGLLKSSDGGASWVAVNHGPSNITVSALAMDPAAPGTVYASVNSASFGGYVYKITDGGASWTLFRGDSIFEWISTPASLAFDPTAPGTVYLVKNYAIPWGMILTGPTYCDVFKSTNGGASWVTLIDRISATADPYGRCTLALDPTAPGTMYVAGHKSTDGGASWAAFDTRGSVLALDPATRTLYASGGNYSGIWKLGLDGDTLSLPDSGAPVALPLPGGSGITASAQRPGTQVQLAPTDSGATVALVTAGSALLQPSVAGQPLAGLPRSGGMAVLTPSCAAARVLVTPTGDTHTALMEGCPVALTGAGDALPTPAQGLSIAQGTIRAEDVRVYASGPIAQRSLLVHLDLTDLPSPTAPLNVYLLALVPGQLLNHPVSVLFERLPTGGWGLVDGPMTAVANSSATLANHPQVVVEVIKEGDLGGLVGTELYVGYGTNHEEMLQAGRYRALYRVQ